MVTWNDVKSCVSSLRRIPADCATRCNEENFPLNEDWCLQNCEARSDDINGIIDCLVTIWRFLYENGRDPAIVQSVKPYLDKMTKLKSGDILLPDHINNLIDALTALVYAAESALAFPSKMASFEKFTLSGFVALTISEQFVISEKVSESFFVDEGKSGATLKSETVQQTMPLGLLPTWAEGVIKPEDTYESSFVEAPTVWVWSTVTVTETVIDMVTYTAKSEDYVSTYILTLADTITATLSPILSDSELVDEGNTGSVLKNETAAASIDVGAIETAKEKALVAERPHQTSLVDEFGHDEPVQAKSAVLSQMYHAEDLKTGAIVVNYKGSEAVEVRAAPATSTRYVQKQIYTVVW